MSFDHKLESAIDKIGAGGAGALSERRRRLVSHYRNKNVLVKCAAGRHDRVAVPGSCALADDFIIHQLLGGMALIDAADRDRWLAEEYDVSAEYGPGLYRVDCNFDLGDLTDLRKLGLGRAVMGSHDGTQPRAIPDDVVREWLVTGNTHGLHASDLARQIKPGVIGIGLVDPEILINVPCAMVIMADLVADGSEPEIGELFYYKLRG